MKEVNVYISVDNKASRKAYRAYIYKLQYGSHYVYGEGKINGTYNQSVLMAMADAVGRIREKCRLHIYSDNVWALNMIKNCLPKWAYEDFKTKKIANRELWERLWQTIKIHSYDLIPQTQPYEQLKEECINIRLESKRRQ